MGFSCAMNQPRFAPGDTGFDSGLGLFGVNVSIAPPVRYEDSVPYPMAGRDPIPFRAAIALEEFRRWHYVPNLVVFGKGSTFNRTLAGNVDPANDSGEAIYQAIAYPYRSIWPRSAYEYPLPTIEDWNRGYINQEGGQWVLHSKWTRPADRWVTGGWAAYGDLLTMAALVVGPVAYGALLAAPAAGAAGAAAGTGAVAMPTAATVVAVPSATAVTAGTGIGTAAVKTVAGALVSKAIATVVTPRKTTPTTASESAQVQARMAAQLQAAQAAQGDNTGLLLAGGLLLLKILL
jgi:hypothetical protein